MNQLNFTHLKGTTFEAQTFTIQKNGSPLSLVGASIKMQLRKCYGTTVALELSNGSGITITNAAGGVFRINGQIINIEPAAYKYDIKITFADGTVEKWIKGEFKVIETITS